MRLVSWVELGSHLIGENPNMAEFIHVKLPDFIPVERKVGGIIHGCAALWVIAYQASVFRAHPYFAVGGSGHSGVVARLGDPDGFLSVFKCIQPFVVDHPQRLPFLKNDFTLSRPLTLKSNLRFRMSYLNSPSVVAIHSFPCGDSYSLVMMPFSGIILAGETESFTCMFMSESWLTPKIFGSRKWSTIRP